MRKYKWLRREDIKMIAHIGLQREFMNSFQADPSSMKVNYEYNQEKFRIFGIEVEFSSDYEKYICVICVPDAKPSVRIVISKDDVVGFAPNETVETFIADIKQIVKP